MCGIIAIVRRRSDRLPPAESQVLDPLQSIPAALRTLAAGETSPEEMARGVVEATEMFAHADGLLRGTPGVKALLASTELALTLGKLCRACDEAVLGIDVVLEAAAARWTPAESEMVNAVMISLRDVVWAIEHDRLRAAAAVGDLAGPDPTDAAIAAFLSVHQALSSIDRLEVRGRDSAGIHLLVRNHGLDVEAVSMAAMLSERGDDPLFMSRAVQVSDNGSIGFVYKAAAEIGELGDNTESMRTAIRSDLLLHKALRGDAEVIVLGHTRWASVGIISEANAHPLNSDETGRAGGPYSVAVLNGDIDNFADLKAHASLQLAPEITTDAKVIPTLLSRKLEEGTDLVEAFRSTVSAFEGSVAIGAGVADAPDRLMLALRGSGQALYIGLAEDLFVVGSEPYGIIEEATKYVRLDGETPSDSDNPTASRGQLLELRADGAGELFGMARWSYNGQQLPVTDADVASAEITTRDIDRGDYPHYLLKEISESPSSFRKTLRGKLATIDGHVKVVLGDDTLPPDLRARLHSGEIRRIFGIGQGTAAVASQSFVRALVEVVDDLDVRVESVLATELSGFAMRADMSDTLVVAVSQSGTTTDTNRTVDLVRSRGASVVSIVNRRGSDLTDKSDGVLYTSDGRDVEMSVASTKAFYAQIAAGFLLAHAIADELLSQPCAADLPAVTSHGRKLRSDLLAGLQDMPDAMQVTIGRRPEVTAAAQQLAPMKRYWAIVGSGPDRIAAQEIRVKLSELCYKSIACDSIEDKKHIDLSSEPLILVCATGLVGSNADDVAKEVAIYRAHKATPIVIATEGEERFSAAIQVLAVPVTHPKLGFILATIIGHLFGYEAALAIDAQARPLREARSALDQLIVEGASGDELLDLLPDTFESISQRWADGLRSGAYDGHLEASTAARITTLLRYAAGVMPLDLYQVDFGRQGTPGVMLDDLAAALSAGIEELTRPVDAIKHQAKTVTVGISRSDEGVMQVPLVRAVFDAGAGRDRLSYRALRTIAYLEPAIAEVTGFTRYRIDGRVDSEQATIVVVDRGGISRDLPLRTETNPGLRGTKHRVAFEREVTVAVGRSDGRSVMLVPEVRGNQCTGITLLHVRFKDRLPAPIMRSVLEGYRDRYAALRDAITEAEPTMRDDILATVPVVDLLTAPVLVLAAKWKSNG